VRGDRGERGALGAGGQADQLRLRGPLGERDKEPGENLVRILERHSAGRHPRHAHDGHRLPRRPVAGTRGSPQLSILKIIGRIAKSFGDREDELENQILPILPKLREILQYTEKTEGVAVEIFLNLTRRLYKLFEHDRALAETKINSIALENGTVVLLMDLARKSLLTNEAKSNGIILNIFSIFNKFAFMSLELAEELATKRIDELILLYFNNSEAIQSQGEDSKIILNEIISFINSLLSISNFQNEVCHNIFGLAGIEILKHHNLEKKAAFVKANEALFDGMLVVERV
jgi:hypothetical protein